MMSRWVGESVAILASGPSLRHAPLQEIDESGCRVIVVNNSWQLAPWADLLYACDMHWWDRYFPEVDARFSGQLWTQEAGAVWKYPRISYIRSIALPGLSRRPGVIHQGGNSGYQAIGLAYQTGAKRIFLFGFDMHGSHWHGEHEKSVSGHLTVQLDFENWIPQFSALASDLKAEGVEVVDCTPGSALECFRKAEFEAPR